MTKRSVIRHTVTQPLNEPFRLIPLTKGKNAIVDASDFEWLSQWNWHAEFHKKRNCFYAATHNGKLVVRMHRMILGCTGKEEGDHRNLDTLDNRRGNLRKCSHAENGRNVRRHADGRSGYKGVTYDKQTDKWRACICINGKTLRLGRFGLVKEAAQA